MDVFTNMARRGGDIRGAASSAASSAGSAIWANGVDGWSPMVRADHFARSSTDAGMSPPQLTPRGSGT